ncbi:MAG: class I SAM-dependent methyltransferase [Actinomycetota bacterium]|nr:class I SAM-dependent methyltransferase [Actinomycetota bacterium]
MGAARMDTALNWTSDDEFAIDGISFICRGAKVGLKSTAHRFCIIKPRWQIERYDQLILETAPKNIVELGIWDGGSTAYFAQRAHPNKLVALDLTPEPCEALESFIETRGLRDAIATYYGVDQADIQKLTEILDREYHGDPLDLVVDDASHLVEETRRSFNFLFPHLSPGAPYVIEDWSSAHSALVPPLATPLSVFVVEVMLACGHRPRLIEEIVIKKGWALVRRGPEAIDPASFDVSTYTGKVGRGLMRNLSRPWSDGEPDPSGAIA